MYKNLWKKAWKRINRPQPLLSQFLRVRVSKLETKIRTRVFLKKCLLEPEYVSKAEPQKFNIELPLSPLVHFVSKYDQPS